MEVVAALIGALIGGFIGWGAQKVHATWLSRRDAAAEGYRAVVALDVAIRSSVDLARRVDKEIRETGELYEIAESAAWKLGLEHDTVKLCVAKLREANMNIIAVWGVEVGELFEAFFRLTRGWGLALGDFHDNIQGYVDPSQWNWEVDDTGYDWQRVIDGTSSDASVFDLDIRWHVEMIRRFARSASVTVVEKTTLPDATQKVLADFNEERARKRVETAEMKALGRSKPAS